MPNHLTPAEEADIAAINAALAVIYRKADAKADPLKKRKAMIFNRARQRRYLASKKGE
jgi:hypothetical protein